MNHYDLEVFCNACGEGMLLAPPEGNSAYVEPCSTCGGPVQVPADENEAAQ